jgi:hypothetical protein
METYLNVDVGKISSEASFKQVHLHPSTWAQSLTPYVQGVMPIHYFFFKKYQIWIFFCMLIDMLKPLLKISIF